MRLRRGIEVAAPAELAWQQLIDLSNWPGWGPTVRSARLDDGSGHLSANASGSVQTVVGGWLPFRIEGWHDEEPIRAWSWRVCGIPATEHFVISRGPTRCRVEMTVPWWGGCNLPVVEVALRKDSTPCAEGRLGLRARRLDGPS